MIPAIDSKSTEALALNLMGTSTERCRYSLSRTIETFSAAITEIMDDFSSIAGRYETVSTFVTDFDPFLSEAVYPTHLLLHLDSKSRSIQQKGCKTSFESVKIVPVALVGGKNAILVLKVCVVLLIVETLTAFRKQMKYFPP